MKNITHSCCEHSLYGQPSRRSFLKTAMFGVGAAMLAPTLIRANAPRFGHTENLLLSCMDYRLVDDTEKYMRGRGLKEKYDHIVLAGASLGALGLVKPNWKLTFWEHLEVAIKLHKVKKLFVMDHYDCGAYKEVLGDGWNRTETIETNKHSRNLFALQSLVKTKYPTLEVELGIMNLNGTVEEPLIFEVR